VSRDERFAQLYSIARKAAAITHHANRDFTDPEDLTQSAMLWLLEHPERIDHNTMPDGRLAHNRLVSEAVRVLVRQAKRERRQALGYDPDAEYTYSVKLVEAVLPGVFDPNHRPVRPEGEEKVSGNRDPSEGNNWAAYVMDLKRAVHAVCDVVDKRILFARSVGGWTWADFGKRYSQSGEWHRVRYHEAVSRLVAWLNDGVVLESSPDAEILSEALKPAVTAPRVDVATSWTTAGRDQYREPEL
jgi:hypothetical protein